MTLRIREDLQNEAGNQLIDLHGEVAAALLHLVLFGQANPYLHNGTMPIADEYGEVRFFYSIIVPKLT